MLSICVMSAQNEEVPSFTLPTPETFQITKYGDVPVNESSGRITPSIPLYTLKSRHLSLPITLNYMGNGVKVDQLPTWTGINWTLNAGGVITRVVKDDPDEFVGLNDRLLITEVDFRQFDLSDDSDDVNFLKDVFLLQTKKYDLKPDVFNFSFPEGSGSFYLDENFNPIITNKKAEFKIEIIGDRNTNRLNLYHNKKFLITSPYGIKYYFGGDEAVSLSHIIDRLNPSATTVPSPTSFYLTKIVHPFGDEINLEYDNDIQSSEPIIMQYPLKAKKLIFVAPVNRLQGGGSPINDTPVPTSPESPKTYINVTTKPKYLKRIYNNYENVIFNSTDPFPYSIYNNYNRVLNSITVNNNLNINLAYEFTGQEGKNDKFFLNKVELTPVNSVNDKQKMIFRMKYKSLENLPNRFSFSKDHLGYFNGKNNTTLLPNNSLNLLDKYYDFDSEVFIKTMLGENNLPPENFAPHQIEGYRNKMNFSSSYYADRDGDIDYASIGALTELYYPTGGHTKFQYEAHTRKDIITERKTLSVFKNNINYPDRLVDAFSIGDINNEQVSNSGVFETQEIKVKFKVTAPEEQPYNGPYAHHEYDPKNRDFIRFKVTNHTTNTVEYAAINESLNMLNLCCLNDVYGNIIEFPFTLIKGHAYTIQLEFISGNLVNSYVLVDAWFEYVSGFEYVEDLGLRIKRVIDYTDDNASGPSNTKRFYYKEIDKIGTPEETPFEVFSVPKYLRFQKNYIDLEKKTRLNNGTVFVEQQQIAYYISILSSESLQSILPSYDSNSLYTSVVISYGGDNFEGGGIEKQFKMYENTPIKTFNTSPLQYQVEHIKLAQHTNESIFNGLNTSVSYFEKVNSSIAKIKKDVYDYQIEVYKTMPNLYGELLPKYTGTSDHITSEIKPVSIGNGITGEVSNVKDLFIGGYGTNAYTNLLKKQTTVEYTEPLLLGANENSVKKLETTVDYTYGDLIGLPTEVTTTDSKGIQKIVKNYYPDQVINSASVNLPELTSDELLAVYELKSNKEHRIASPIQTEFYEKDGENARVLLSSKRTIYSINANGLVQMNAVQTSKNRSNYEDRIIYHSYDSKGNPTEVSKKGGTHVVYIWGYNQTQPIAKIDNATFDNVVLAISSINDNRFNTLSKIQDLSNNDNDRTQGNSGREGILREALDLLRNSSALINSQVTTFTYDPSIGITSVVDPRGEVVYYEYDDFLRLEFVKDGDGHILKKNTYNYKE